MLRSKLPDGGTNTTLGECERLSAISRQAWMRRSSMKPGPFFIALEIKRAASASPSALETSSAHKAQRAPSARARERERDYLMTAAFFSCLDLSTMYLERSASCCATCFLSILSEYSREKLKCVIATSSSTMSKLAER